jgi:hypothetical protein
MVTPYWGQAECERIARDVPRQLELLNRQRADLVKQQMAERQRLEQAIKIAQDQHNYSQLNEAQRAQYAFIDHYNQMFRQLDDQIRRLNENLAMAQQNLTRFEEERKARSQQ